MATKERRKRPNVVGVRMTDEELAILRDVERATGETSGVLVRRWMRAHHARLAGEFARRQAGRGEG